jgi:AraC-like DNA-binding protein
MSVIRKKEGFKGQRAIVLPRKVIAVQCAGNSIIDKAYITDIGYYPKAVNHYRRRAQGIDQNILVYCVEGKGWLETDNLKQTITAGNFFIVPANTPHTYGTDETAAWTIYWIHVKGERADAICAAIIAKFRGFKGIVQYSEQRIALFNEMYSSLERGYSSEHVMYANMCLSHYLASFYLDEKFTYSHSAVVPDTASIAIDFMQENMGTLLTLRDIASHVNLSVSHFAGIFQKRTGFAPIEYFNHLKIQKACQYLQFTDESIREISSRLGIEDSYYFSRLFKKLMGRSPQHYRKRFKNEK